MKKIIYIVLIATALIIQGCGNEFLDTRNLYEKLDVDYYKTPQDINEALTAAYACLANNSGANNQTLMSNLMSDDCLGGGGVADNLFHDLDRCTAQAQDNFLEYWTVQYTGIFRANMIIYRFDQAQYTDEVAKNQALGETYFLRGYFYLKLAEFFGNVPLITEPKPVNYPKASEDAIFGQIASDFKKAIELMPATKFTSIPVENLGHATKWAAEGMMARAFLFYTGKYSKSEITLPAAEGGSITKDQVISWIDDCAANSGHGLIPDFRNIWPYSYATADYPYAAHNNLSWVGETGGNFETVFAVKYSPYGNWNTPGKLSYSNQLVLYSAMREQPSLVPWGNGWGAGPVNPQLWTSFEDKDLRKKGSIIDITDPEEGNVSTDYMWGGQNVNGVEETGFCQKKYTPIVVNTDLGIRSMFFVLYGGQNNMQLWNMQDEILLRYADILLMGAELGSSKAQEYFDKVRTRAGLDTKGVSLANIKEERRHEFAFEGIRYFDLLRWHDEVAAFDLVKNIPVKSIQLDEFYSSSYRPETNGFLAIPESQILLSQGTLVQNPGW